MTRNESQVEHLMHYCMQNGPFMMKFHQSRKRRLELDQS